MRTIRGGNFSWGRGVTRVVVPEDTEFVEANFQQKYPHTVLFDCAPGVSLVFKFCNLINVTVPEGADIFRSNNAQVETIPTGDPLRPETNLLHECDKCATFVKAVRDDIASGRGYSVHGRLDLVKPAARALRLDPVVVEAELARQRQENMDACIRLIPQLSDPAITGEAVVDVEVDAAPVSEAETTAEAEKQGWFAGLWSATRKFLGF